MAELGRDWTYDLQDGSVAMLKPHGSIDWFDSETSNIKRSLTTPVIDGIDRLRVFRHFRMPRIQPLVTPIIVPSLLNKKWKYTEFDRIWRCAWRALRTASEIHIIGFSLPPEDLHVRFVIRSATRINEENRNTGIKISVVNPDKAVYLKFNRLLRSRVRYFETGFDGIDLDDLTH